MSNTFEVLIEHSYAWMPIDPPPASPTTPWLFDFQSEPVVKALEGIVVKAL